MHQILHPLVIIACNWRCGSEVQRHRDVALGSGVDVVVSEPVRVTEVVVVKTGVDISGQRHDAGNLKLKCLNINHPNPSGAGSSNLPPNDVCKVCCLSPTLQQQCGVFLRKNAACVTKPDAIRKPFNLTVVRVTLDL